MADQFASGKHAIAECDRCGRRVRLTELRRQVVAGQYTNLMVCYHCEDVDHPQLQLGKYPVYDPQALRNPRPERNADVSRDMQWGWAPVGGSPSINPSPNALVIHAAVGDVTVTTS